MKGRVLSGIQPTGNFHIGNYFGALNQWVALQEEYECLFCVVDLHAITVPCDPRRLHQHTREVAAVYMAAGIDGNRHAIFPQSAVAAHAELAWVFSCMTPIGWLNRMTQFKDKAGKNKENASLGLYAYPVLMAADILAYHATHVPVGEDQKQHLELARDIAGAFNRAKGHAYFQLPAPLIPGQKNGARVMSLRDGTAKMSKSDPAEGSRICFKDTDDEIVKKIRKAKTDALPFPHVFDQNLEARPEVYNLISIFGLMTNQSPQSVCDMYGGGDFAPFKKALAEAAVARIGPIRHELNRLLQDVTAVDAVLKAGAEKASVIADKTLKEVYALMGLYR